MTTQNGDTFILRLALKFTFVVLSFHVMIGGLIVPSQNAEFPGVDGANYAFGFMVLLQVSIEDCGSKSESKVA